MLDGAKVTLFCDITRKSQEKCDNILLFLLTFLLTVLPIDGGGDLVFLHEVGTEGAVVGEAGGLAHLADAHVGTGDEQTAGVLQAQVADETRQRLVRTALGESRANLADADPETVDGGLTVEQWVEIELLVADALGNLSFAENFKQIPFEIKRTYWLYDVPGGESRGGHAYRSNEEFIIAMSGSFDVILDDGKERKVYSLNRSYFGLYVPAGLWREMGNFSTNALALEFGSTHYDEADYIYDYEEFLKLKTDGKI